MKSLFLLVFFSFDLFCSTECRNEVKDPGIMPGHVTGITDGDTFTLLSNEKKQVKIRLYGIDCPEKKQDFGQVAKQKLSALIFNKDVFIKKTGTDRYGRTVALVYDEANTCINEEMLESGLAWHYLKYDTNPAWDKMQDNARQKKIGLWAQPNPIPPWNWRAMKKSPVN